MKTMRLGQLNKGQSGVIHSVREAKIEGEDFTQRLLEMGLLEGSTVEIVHEAPFGGDPVAIRVRGALIALRREEANCVEVICE